MIESKLALCMLDGGIHLPPKCKIDYVNIQYDYVDMQLVYVNMLHHCVDMQQDLIAW